jgi:hypothetical protein
MKIREVWDGCLIHEKIRCITAVDFFDTNMRDLEHGDERIKRRRGFRKNFYLMGGSEHGQLLYIDTLAKGRQEVVMQVSFIQIDHRPFVFELIWLVQAHSAEITALKFDPQNMYIISGGKGNV